MNNALAIVDGEIEEVAVGVGLEGAGTLIAALDESATSQRVRNSQAK